MDGVYVIPIALFIFVFVINNENGAAVPLLPIDMEATVNMTAENTVEAGPRFKKALEGPTVLLAPASGYSLIAFLLDEGLGSLRGSESERTCHLAMDALRCGADSTEALVSQSKPQTLLNGMNDVSVMALHDVIAMAPEDASWMLVMERHVAEDLMNNTNDSDTNVEVYKNVSSIVEWLEKDGSRRLDWTTTGDTTTPNAR